MPNYKFHKTAPVGLSPEDRNPKMENGLTNF